MKKRMVAAFLTACLVLGSWHMMPVAAAESDEAVPVETVQLQETETDQMQEVLETAQTEALPEMAETEVTEADETEALPEMPETQTESENAPAAETEAEAENGTETEAETFIGTEAETADETETETVIETETGTETADEQDPGSLYDLLRASAWENEEAVLLEAGTTARKVKAVGVDVWNGNGKIDWNKAKAAGVQFAIIRVGFRYLGSAAYEVDARAKENMDGAKAAGIPFGVYFFSTAINVNEGLDEARLVIKTIRNYKLDYPVFFDPEGYDIKGMRNYGVSKSVRTNIALKFMNYIENNGYEAAMYSSKSHLTASAYWETPKLDSDYDIWVAQYPGGLNTLASGKSAQTTYAGKYRIWQFSSSGRVGGISGDVDLNVEYYDSTYTTAVKAPTVLKKGAAYNVSGNVISDTPITKVTAAVFDSSEQVKIRAFAYPKTRTYNVSNVASKLKFQNLEPGIYRYQIGISNSEGSEVVFRQFFIVLANDRTIADGSYTIALRDTPDKVLGVKDQLNTVPKNLILTDKDKENNHAKYQVTYDKNGYYKITVLDNKKGVGLNGSVAVNTSVSQVASAVRWQLLPYPDGSLALVPEGTNGLIATAGASSGAVCKLLRASFAARQCFVLEKTSWFEPLSIKGESVPVSIKQGWAFKPAGVITSGKALKSVNVRVYAAGGTTILNKTVSLTGKTYDLAKMQSAMNFRTLEPGMYVYRVTAKNASQSKILVKKAFAVLSNERTVADGVYTLRYKANTSYTAYVAGKSNVSNANICLGVYQANNNYEKFRIRYKSNGYYTIQCVANGENLNVADSKADPGTNVVQSNASCLWQIIPDNGGYALIPGSNWQSILCLQSGKTVNGQNILLTGVNTSAISCWSLNKTSIYGKPAVIKGQTIPGNLSAGQSFSVRGTISSTTKLTKVNVGIYDSSGNVKSFQSAAPNSTTFDLSNVDAKIKFGSLKAGTYYYRVVAINGYGYTMLINQKFTVR